MPLYRSILSSRYIAALHRPAILPHSSDPLYRHASPLLTRYIATLRHPAISQHYAIPLYRSTPPSQLYRSTPPSCYIEVVKSLKIKAI